MKRSIRTAALASLSLLMLVAGCFTTKYSIGKSDDAKIDLNFVGNWAYTKDGAETTVIIRNIDSHQYYVEWQTKDKVNRFIGFVAPIKDARFAQLRELSADGSIPEEHAILRVDLKDGKLILKHLKEDFFKDKSIDSDDALKKVLAENLDNEQMYDETDTLAKLPNEPRAAAGPDGL